MATEIAADGGRRAGTRPISTAGARPPTRRRSRKRGDDEDESTISTIPTRAEEPIPPRRVVNFVNFRAAPAIAARAAPWRPRRGESDDRPCPRRVSLLPTPRDERHARMAALRARSGDATGSTWLRLSEADYRAASFLDQRMLGAGLARSGNAPGRRCRPRRGATPITSSTSAMSARP